MNRCYVSGNLTKDGELRTTQGGTEILTFGIAVNDRKRDPSSGEWVEVPNFFDCVVFGKRADSLSRLLHRGMKCCIEGKLRWSQWNDKSGQKRSKVEIIVDEIEFMSRQGDSKAQNQPQQQQPNNYINQYQNEPYSASQQPQTGYQQSTGYQSDLSEEPIPF